MSDETKHSREPWRALLNGSGPHSVATTASRVVVSFCRGIENPEDARRIVAAVNACAGIPTSELERLGEAGLLRALNGLAIIDAGGLLRALRGLP
jgi:hypothetical protein